MSPLEQFEILPILNLPFIVLTNSTLIILLGIFFLLFYLKYYKNGIFIQNRWSFIFEFFNNTVLELSYLNINFYGSFFLSFIFSLFLFILIANFVGMVPYSFTITSHLIVTFALALTIYIGFNFIGLKKHKLNFLSLLLPTGASIFLTPLLVPIELVSYIFRVISLPVRLFANMMAGHTLLKVIVGFAWTMANLKGFIFFAHLLPLILLVLLIGLELGVAFIQAYVFVILVCMYINDAINLH